MIKLLLIAASFIAACFVIYIINSFDSTLSLTIHNSFLGDYFIDTTIFSVALALFALIIIVKIILFIFRGILLVLAGPYLIIQKYKTKKQKNHSERLVAVMLYIIMGEKDKALKVLSQIELNMLPAAEQDYSLLLLASTTEESKKKIEYLEQFCKLKNYPDLKYLATKHLAQIACANNDWPKATDYAVKSFNLQEHDMEVLEILVDCYGKTKIWDKFIFIVTKITRANVTLSENLAHKIAEYYFLAAQDILSSKPASALNYLKLALEFNFGHADALRLYCSLTKISNNDLVMIKKAFNTNPCMDIAYIYMKYCNLFYPDK